MAKLSKAVFLDRDGVINKPIIKKGISYGPTKLKDFKLFPKVKNAVINLKKKGYKVFLLTNQPDVSRGKIKKEVVVKMHNYLLEKIKLDDIFVCYHDDRHNCKCRKPKPGLLIYANKKWNLNLKKSYVVGDRWKDIKAGKHVGCKTIFIDLKYKERKPRNPDFISDSLFNAVSARLLAGGTLKRLPMMVGSPMLLLLSLFTDVEADFDDLVCSLSCTVIMSPTLLATASSYKEV